MQQALIHEDLNDALREVILALGGTKVVAAKMRPEKTPDEAARWLADCLNADRPAQLHPEQLLWLLREGRKINSHAAIRFVCAESGYQEPIAADPEDERAKLQREFTEATKSLMSMAARIERLSQPQVVGRAAA